MATLSNPKPYGFIRRMDPTRDLNAVATLMEEAFELKRDPENHTLIENMRRHARMLACDEGNLLDRMTIRASWSDGLVWEDQGQVVGNISLIPHLDGFKRVTMIANVSVDEAYRRKGIARELTLQGLRRCQLNGVRDIYLQVRHDNQAAIDLYRDLGFNTLHSISQWRLRQRPSAFSESDLAKSASEANFVIGKRKWGDWKTQKAWLAQAYPKRTRWYANISFAALSPFSWLVPSYWSQMMQAEHFALRKNGQLLGMLSWQRQLTQCDILLLALPEGLDEGEENLRAFALLNHFVNSFWDYKKVNLEFPISRATKGIQEAGFKLVHDLDWMALRV